MCDFAAQTYLVLGAKGLIGTEVCKELMLLGAPKKKIISISSKDRFPEVAPNEKLIIINSTSANGGSLSELITKLTHKYCNFEFWHISSQAVQNNSQYGLTKYQDENIVLSMCARPKIYRLGIPIIQSGDTYHGLGYWNSIRLVRGGTVNAYNISLCGIKLHLIKEMVIALASDDPTEIKLKRYPLQSLIRRYVPFRRLNRVLSSINTCVIG